MNVRVFEIASKLPQGVEVWEVLVILRRLHLLLVTLCYLASVKLLQEFEGDVNYNDGEFRYLRSGEIVVVQSQLARKLNVIQNVLCIPLGDLALLKVIKCILEHDNRLFKDVLVHNLELKGAENLYLPL